MVGRLSACDVGCRPGPLDFVTSDGAQVGLSWVATAFSPTFCTHVQGWRPPMVEPYPLRRSAVMANPKSCRIRLTRYPLMSTLGRESSGALGAPDNRRGSAMSSGAWFVASSARPIAVTAPPNSTADRGGRWLHPVTIGRQRSRGYSWGKPGAQARAELRRTAGNSRQRQCLTTGFSTCYR